MLNLYLIAGATLLILYYAWRRRDEEEGKKEASESDEEAKATEVSRHLEASAARVNSCKEFHDRKKAHLSELDCLLLLLWM